MNQTKILITGASGCVGQHITNWLLKNSNSELFLWVRDPQKLTAISNEHKERINLLIGDLRDSYKFEQELKTINRVIHTATAWGDPQRAHEVNVLAVKTIFDQLDPEIIEQIIYFSTASILNKDLTSLKEAKFLGTEYIQTKAQCLQELEDHNLAEKIIAVFPTLVFGGMVNKESNYPTSYLTDGLKEACNWLWLARWLKAYSRFHFIHAEDIGFICGHLATSPHRNDIYIKERKIQRLVLAQPLLTIDEAIDTLCKWRGLKKVPKLPLWKWLINGLIKILPIKITKWDRFSLKQRHFDYLQITCPESFGGKSYAKTLSQVIALSGLPSRSKSKKQAKLF